MVNKPSVLNLLWKNSTNFVDVGHLMGYLIFSIFIRELPLFFRLI